MNTVPKITVIGPEIGNNQTFSEAVLNIFNGERKECDIDTLPLSQITPDNVGDVVITTDSAAIDGRVYYDVDYIVQTIRDRAGKLVPIIVYCLEADASKGFHWGDTVVRTKSSLNFPIIVRQLLNP